MLVLVAYRKRIVVVLFVAVDLKNESIDVPSKKIKFDMVGLKLFPKILT